MPVAVITGGNKGLGFYQTQKFLREGYQVYVVSRSQGDLEELSEFTENGQLVAMQSDLEHWQDSDWLDEIHAQSGNVDVLINNAGAHLKKPAWEVAPDELERVLNLNVKALFTACGRYVELHKHQGGAIVNISSMGGLMALPRAAAYVTAKTAVIGLTRSIAVDAMPLGIRCNAVCPGFIETDMTRAILAKDPVCWEKIEGRVPGGKFGTPNDVAEACFFLGSPAARYINGVALPVDAGYAIGF